MQALIRHCNQLMNSAYSRCQSGYVCFAKFERVAMKNARAMLLNCFSDVIFPHFHAIFTKHLRPKSKF